MEPEDFLRSNGWRQFSKGYDKVGFSKGPYELLHVLEAVMVERDIYGTQYSPLDQYLAAPISFWKPQPTFDICLSCGSQDYASYTRADVYLAPTDTMRTGCIVECDKCKTIKRTVWRDANGDAIQYDDSKTGQYSYATGERFQGKKHFSEYLRKNDLIQKGTSRNTNDKRLKG